ALDGKRYPSLEKIALPARDAIARLRGEALEHLSAAAPATASLDLAGLATVLLFGAGIRETDAKTAVKTLKPKRWAATGGNLGSPELFVAVHDVDDLAPGLYFYQAHEHVLARFVTGWRAIDAARFIDRVVDRDGETPNALIIATAALHRLAHK